MSTRSHLPGALALALLSAAAFAAAPPKSAPYRVSGPFTHDNLTVFLLHGKDQLEGKKLLTLDEALAAKKVVVHETKDVNQLSIENVGEQDVFVQAGDIVKGGQQDRTLAADLIVPARSGKIPVGAFCVEHGRWSARGKEDDKKFDSSKNNLATNPLKLAARLKASQSEVWKSVDAEQKRLRMKLNAEVKDARSGSSLQLTLENKKLLEAVDGYVKAVTKAAEVKGDVIGCAVVINGKVQSADVYANADLFTKLWPKLLKASAIEAIAEKDAKKKFDAVKAEQVLAFLADPDKGKASHKDVSKGVRESQKETEKNVLFETTAGKAVLRRSYLAK